MTISICGAIAQLGERQTEDLKVPGSIPAGPTIFLFFRQVPLHGHSFVHPPWATLWDMITQTLISPKILP